MSCSFCFGDHGLRDCPNIDPEQLAIELQRDGARQWIQEFGVEYAAPAPCDALDDCSWHNDISPSFTIPGFDLDGDRDIRLWVDHPDPMMREDERIPRFRVCDSSEPAELFASETD